MYSRSSLIRRGLTAALERLGCPAEQTMYIGDRPEIDGEVARCAGIRSYAFRSEVEI